MAAAFLVMRDTATRTALRAELREAGVEALGLETPGDVGVFIARGTVPAVVVMEGAELGDPAMREAMARLARRVPLLVLDSRTAPAPEIPGAERLWRPVRIGDIVARVLSLLARPAA